MSTIFAIESSIRDLRQKLLKELTEINAVNGEVQAQIELMRVTNAKTLDHFSKQFAEYSKTQETIFKNMLGDLEGSS